MAIANIPPSYAEFEEFNCNYERQYFTYADSNRRVEKSTINIFLSWFLLRPVLKPFVEDIFGDRAISAFGFNPPAKIIRNSIAKSLKLKSWLSKGMLPRNNPDFYTDSQLRSYPNGYKLQDLDLTKMLETLNKSTSE